MFEFYILELIDANMHYYVFICNKTVKASIYFLIYPEEDIVNGIALNDKQTLLLLFYYFSLFSIFNKHKIAGFAVVW